MKICTTFAMQLCHYPPFSFSNMLMITFQLNIQNFKGKICLQSIRPFMILPNYAKNVGLSTGGLWHRVEELIASKVLEVSCLVTIHSSDILGQISCSRVDIHHHFCQILPDFKNPISALLFYLTSNIIFKLQLFNTIKKVAIMEISENCHTRHTFHLVKSLLLV